MALAMMLVVLLMLMCLLISPVWAQTGPILVSRKQLAHSHRIPTDVAVDSQGRMYVLYGQSGGLDIFKASGKLLERRGRANRSPCPTQLVPVDQWVGRKAATLLLAERPGKQLVDWVLVADHGTLHAIHLGSAPRPLKGRAAVARDLKGRIFVYLQASHTVYVYRGTDGHYQNSIELKGHGIRVTQFAVDSRHDFYILGDHGLSVFAPSGNLRYTIPGATHFYLTGADRLGAVGDGWIRRFGPYGGLAREIQVPARARGLEAVAISLNDASYAYVYYRDRVTGRGVMFKFSPQGIPVARWDQTVRFPASPDPGLRLDYRGRVHFWDANTQHLRVVAAGGALKSLLSYTPAAGPKGSLGEITDMAMAPDGTLWLADPTNFRLQRFNLKKGGWLSPVGVTIRGAAVAGCPRQLAITPTGNILCVVHPPGGSGKVYLQVRDGKGRLISQKALCQAAGNPVVEVAVSPSDGSIFIYRTGGSPANSDYYDTPLLQKFSARGDLLASVGGPDQDFHLPGQFLARVELEPQEDMLPYRGDLLLPTADHVLVLDQNLQVTRVLRVRLPYGLVEPDFGGATIRGQNLLVSDLANRCVHRIPLQGL